MADLSIDSFKSKLTGGGARPNLFRVTVNFPSYADGDTELTSFMCSKAVFPASKAGVVDLPFRGRMLPLEGDRTYDPVTLGIINDTNHPIREAFLKWKNEMSNHSSNEGLSDPADYYTDILIEQLDKSGAVTVTHKLVGSFPESVGEIALDFSTNDTIETFDVSMKYMYWEQNGVTQ